MKPLREGYSTGACAAAAAKAAALFLVTGTPTEESTITLPDGEAVTFKLLSCRRIGDATIASVRKDAGDDPDITNGVEVTAMVTFNDGEKNGETPRSSQECPHFSGDGDGVRFIAGDGVGTVTKPGLAIPPGEPAINPVPRKMIAAAINEVFEKWGHPSLAKSFKGAGMSPFFGVTVTISIPGGKELAEKTFNPKLGIVGGLSILGTTGRVRPFSCEAIRCSLKCELDVTAAAGVAYPIFAPGNIGARAAEGLLDLGEGQLIHIGNEWGYGLDYAATLGFKAILILGHPGKLAKLAAGEYDTHSSRSRSAVPFVADIVLKATGQNVADANTVEDIFLRLDEVDREKAGSLLAEEIASSVHSRYGDATTIAVLLVNLAGERLGEAGECSPWRRKA